MQRERIRRRVRILAPALAAVLLLTGCTEQGAQQTQPGTASKPWTEWTDPTTAAVTFSGKTTDGTTFASKDHLGQVLVVNFWYAGCAPCRAEAPTLNAAAKAFPSVQFVGVNVADDASTAAAFDRSHGTTYPSILDEQQDAATQLAFAGSRPPKAVPSTLVLDRKGRVVARIVGQADGSVLKSIIKDAVDGTAA